MDTETTIFSQIIDRKIPAKILYEDEELICIEDKFPMAPVHVLLITKKPIPSIQEMQEQDFHLLGKIVKVAQQLAEKLGIEKNYRFLTNCGKEAGQTIYHLHFHLLGGKKLGPKGG